MNPRTDRFPTLSSELLGFAAAFQEGELEGLVLDAQGCRSLAERFKGLAVRAAWLELAEDRVDGLDFREPEHRRAEPDPKIALFTGVRRERPQLTLLDGGVQ